MGAIKQKEEKFHRDRLGLAASREVAVEGRAGNVERAADCRDTHRRVLMHHLLAMSDARVIRCERFSSSVMSSCSRCFEAKRVSALG